MRIAIFHNLPSGGAKRTLFEEARRLAAAHQLDVFTLSSADHGFADLRPHALRYDISPFTPAPIFSSPFGRFNQIIRAIDLIRLRGIYRRIARKIEQGNYDVALVHPCRYENSPTILKYLKNIPTVFYCHEPLRLLYETMPVRPYDEQSTSRRRALNRIDPLPGLYRNVLKRADFGNIRSASLVLVNSKFIQVAVWDIYGVQAEVSYHGVDADWFRPLPLAKQDMVLSAGSLTPLKGFDFIVQALAEIPTSRRPKFCIASNFQNPPEKEYLAQLARETGVCLEMAGSVGDENLVELYNHARVTLYAPLREPFGLVPLESMACTTPVVAINEGGIPESMIDGQTGRLVDRDVKQFAKAVELLLANPELSEKYGQNGREHILRNWTWDQAVSTMEAHLKKQL